MKALARALINAAAYLEMTGEEGIDPESALQALEEIAYNLSYCTDEEKKALAAALTDMRAAELETGPRPEMLDFLDTFLVSFGLAGDEEPGEPQDPPRINLL